MTIDGISGTIGSSPVASSTARLTDVAQQFEAVLLQQLLKPMQSSGSKWDKDDDDGDNSADTMTAYGIEAVAKAISKAGGLGIAKQVIRQVGPESTQNKGKSWD